MIIKILYTELAYWFGTQIKIIDISQKYLGCINEFERVNNV
jgi:hypothetical protein